jgi:hypothetical protein
MTSDSSVQFDKRVTEDKISQHLSQRKSLNFYPTALFSAKPYLLSLLQNQKSCITCFIFYFGMQHICFCPNAQNPFFIDNLFPNSNIFFRLINNFVILTFDKILT